MPTLHLEYNGKNAKIGIRSLPREADKTKSSRFTSTGPVERIKALSGLRELPGVASEALIQGDPELDLTQIGRILDAENLTGVYLDDEGKPIGDFEVVEVITDPTGAVKETRKPNRNANLEAATPIKVTKTFPLEQVLSRFVFKGSYQLVHEDGLTKSFLYDLAKALADKNEVAALGSGLKGNGPLIIKNGSLPVRGFLIGQVSGNDYKLILMVTDTELKRPAEAIAAPAKVEASATTIAKSA